MRILRARRSRGSAAVEFALVLPIFLVLLTAPIMLCMWFYHYTALAKATFDSARYLSTVSAQEMRDPALAAASADVARTIVLTEIAELRPNGAVNVDIFCGDNRQCNGVRSGALPQFVTVRVELYLADDIFRFFDTGRYGWPVVHETSMPFAGWSP